MTDQPVASEQVDDVELALRMMDGDEEALSCVIRHYSPKVMGALRSKYRNQVPEDVLEDAINRAAFSLWRSADRFNDSKGSLGGLFYKCACHEVVNILRQGKDAPHISLDDLDRDIPGPRSTAFEQNDEEFSPEKQKLYRDLHEVIQGLRGHQRAIAEADLVTGCQADNVYLANVLSTSKNSVYVSRNKARENIRQEMRKRGHFK